MTSQLIPDGEPVDMSTVELAERYGSDSMPYLAAGQPTAAVLELCFWEAITRCVTDENGPLKLVVCEDDSEGGINFGPRIPAELWEHMTAAISELRWAAGLA